MKNKIYEKFSLEFLGIATAGVDVNLMTVDNISYNDPNPSDVQNNVHAILFENDDIIIHPGKYRAEVYT